MSTDSPYSQNFGYYLRKLDTLDDHFKLECAGGEICATNVAAIDTHADPAPESQHAEYVRHQQAVVRFIGIATTRSAHGEDHFHDGYVPVKTSARPRPDGAACAQQGA